MQKDPKLKKGAYLPGYDLSNQYLCDVDLARACFRGGNLHGVYMPHSHLAWVDFSDADLSFADFTRANMSGCNFENANLTGAHLCAANLSGAFFMGADLTDAVLTDSNLTRATFFDSKLTFSQWPSLHLISSLDLGELSDELTAELMRREAWWHPEPDKFERWLKTNQNHPRTDTNWCFIFKADVYDPGPPRMRDSDLIVRICQEKGWKIRE